jgi:transcriptional regulator with XRE-family HTH domain
MEKLKRLREASGLSQVKLAARADLNPATVNQIERGMRDASPGTLRKLADALGVSLYELMEEGTPKDQSPLSLEEATSGPEPLYNAYEALGRVHAARWKVELDEWNKKIPTGSAPDSFYIGRLFDWVVGIGATKSDYETIAIDAYSPPRKELRDTLMLMDGAYEEALQKCLKVLKPAKEYAEVRKIVEDNNLRASILLNYFKSHTRRVYIGLYGADRVDSLAEDVSRFLEDRGGSWTGQPSELYETLTSNHKPERAKDLSADLAKAAQRSPVLSFERDKHQAVTKENGTRTTRRVWVLSLVNTVNLVNGGGAA